MADIEEQSSEDSSLTTKGSRLKRNFFATAVLSFLLGMIAMFIATETLFGINPGAIWDNYILPRSNKMSQSERLIAEGSVIEIAKRVRPSVVNIQTQQVNNGGWRSRDIDGVGSGIIIRSDGYILTNEHVVAKAKKILVGVKGKKLVAEVVGTDKETDVAVIKINTPEKLPVPKFGSAQALKVGELAVAVGSPFGFQKSVTAGVISALDRNVTVNEEIEAPRTYANLIQTDAAINPGNSGGALSNRQGEVVGMNSLIYSTTGVSQGIGFAIPIDLARRVAYQLMEQGRASHPFIGVFGQTITQELAAEKKLSVDSGVLVVKILETGPARRAGIVPGDVIIGMDNKEINAMDELISKVRERKVGASVILTIVRQGQNRQVTIVLSEKPREIK